MAARGQRLKQRRRSDYGFLLDYRTRWYVLDVLDFLYDSVVNAYLISHCSLHPTTSPQVGLVAHSSSDYFAPVSFPAVLDLGMRVTRLGNTSVTYEIGVFERAVEEVKAVGQFVHVFVDLKGAKPVPSEMAKPLREGLERLLVRDAQKSSL
ncbi:MAG: hypothetical protein M1832_003457 [Thelocarpon impressellum]|nr:MAG: hypothetical protein M1832_003457 [Thelocarpon impressellum]